MRATDRMRGRSGVAPSSGRRSGSVVFLPVPGQAPAGRACSCDGACPRCRGSSTVQPSSTNPGDLGQSGDRFEREADRVADEVINEGGRSSVISTLPRGEARSQTVNRTLAAVQRAIGGISARAPLSYDVPSPDGPGRPMDPDMRTDFEERFGHDLGGVRLHTGAQSASAARQISARAYTQGRDIHFAAGEYRPDTRAGRQLLAHELTHTIQQRNRPASVPVQRAVSPDMDRIRDELATSFWSFDWAVTDEEAHRVLQILNGLNEADLRDTVAVMEREGLVDKLFGNVSDEDQADFENLLQRIQDARVHTDPQGNTVMHSCSPERLQEVQENVAETQEWARISKEAVEDFIADPRGSTRETTLLDRHFFHQSRNRSLSQALQVDYAGQIRDNLDDIEQQNNPFDIACPSPFDSLCASSTAYVDHGDRRVYFCDSFFRYSETGQTAVLFHEFAHAFAGVSDTGYSSERIFRYLPPQDAINNADSYELFARDVVPDAGGSAGQLRSQGDDIDDCSPSQVDILQRDIAIGERLIRNAINIISDPDLTGAGTYQGIVETHFKTSDRSELTRVSERFRTLEDEFDSSLNVECETDCESDAAGYYYPLGNTVHVCPDYFAYASEDERADILLVMIILEREGLNQPVYPVSGAYGGQSEDEAYDNPAAYVAFSRAVSEEHGDWNFLSAEFRYGRDIRSMFERREETALEQITTERHYRRRVASRIFAPLSQALEDELSNNPPINEQVADSVRSDYLGRLGNLSQLARMTSDAYFAFSVDADVLGLLADAPHQDAWESITGRLRFQMQRDLLEALDHPAQQISEFGIRVAVSPWPALETIDERYEQALRVAESYLPRFSRSQGLMDRYNELADRRRARLPADQRDAFNDFVDDEAWDLIDDVSDLQSEMLDRIRSGEEFSEDMGLENPDELLERYRRRMRRFRAP